MVDKFYDCVVIGSGPGGYASAFRLADLGLSVALIERYASLGGVCLNVGCIPSKALLHIAELINQQDHLSSLGLKSSPLKLDIHTVKEHKNGIVKKLTAGLSMVAKQRKVNVIEGVASFQNANTLKVVGSDSIVEVTFKHCVLATGSRPIKLPFLPEDERIFDSTGALSLNHTEGRLLVIGGGVIGCEMATVYRALGMEVTVVEMLDQIMPGADLDLIKPCQTIMSKRGITFHLSTQVTHIKALKKSLDATLKFRDGNEITEKFHAILQCVGRIPNSNSLGLEKANIAVDDKGFVIVDPKTLQTNLSHIYAIGDLIGNPMLAHKSTAQGRVVAEMIVGKKVIYDARAIPSVAYTDPEVAWVGMTEQEAKQANITYEKGVFPWKASGRALCIDATDGFTKVLTEPNSGRLLGAGIVGKSAGDLIAELTLAIEMGATLGDIALTIHPHPTLAETVGLASEACEGTITDLYMPKSKDSDSD